MRFLVVIVLTFVLVAAESDTSFSFRCQRPLESMLSFKPKDHSRNNKCDFGPLRVLDAYTRIITVNGSAKVHVFAQFASQDNTLSELKHLRYTLELLGPDKALSVKYQGFDNGQGYEVCTAFANETNLICNIAPGQGGEWIWDGEVSRSVFRIFVMQNCHRTSKGQKLLLRRTYF